MFTFICYSKCSTCKKAEEYLNHHNISYTKRDIVSNPPTYKELKDWYDRFSLDITKLFNTSGNLYKEGNYKEKRKTMSLEEELQALSSNGMLVKRPILLSEDKILLGFKEKDYETL